VGGDLNLTDSFGNVDIEGVEGNVDITSANGSVTARSLRGNAGIRNTFGRIDISDVAGDAALSNSNAPVRLRNVGGSARVRNGFGQIDLAEISNTNGSVEISGVAARSRITQKCNEIHAQTSFAPLKVWLDPGAGHTVEANTAFGEIIFDTMTLSGTVTKHSVNGTIGSGECRLILSNRNSNIEIRKAAGK